MNKILESQVMTRAEIPETPFYVLSNDRFMSHWGRSTGKINVVIVPCETMEDAERVERYAKEIRTDQSRVRLVSCKPKLRAHAFYSLVPDWIETSKTARKCA